MITPSNLEKWQKAIQGIEAGQKDLSSEELSAYNTLKELFNSGNFEASGSGGNIQIIKNALPNLSKNRLLRAHLTNFVALCEEIFTNKSVPVTQPQVQTPAPVPPPEIKPQAQQETPAPVPQPATPAPTFGGIPSEDIAAWQKAVQGIESVQKDLSSEELSAFQALKNLFNNGNFEASGSGGYIKIIKDALPSHSKHRLLQIVHLPNFIKLCEKYFKVKQDAVIEPTPTVVPPPVVPPNTDTQTTVPAFQPPVFQPPATKQPETKVEIPKVEPPKVEPPKVENPPLPKQEPEKPKKSNLKLILIVVAIVLLIGGWQVYDNWNVWFGKPNEITLDKSSLSFENIGESEQLTATLFPDDIPKRNREIIWQSSDTLVATVDENGVITAVTSGSAVITAFTVNELSVSCFVTVKDIEIALGDTLLSVSDTIVDMVETSVQEVEKVTPKTATKKDVKEPTKSQQKESTNQKLITKTYPFGKYDGYGLDGYPEGQGTMYYSKRVQIAKHSEGTYFAEEGDTYVGLWGNGDIVNGKLMDKNNKLKATILAGKRPQLYDISKD